MIYYSPNIKAFYDTEVVDYPSLPDDVIEITKEEHAVFIHALNMSNKDLVLNNNKLELVERVIEITWEKIRTMRTRYLLDTDYTQMPDYPGDKEAWATYRQALRDIPQTYVNPADVVWPTPPGE